MKVLIRGAGDLATGVAAELHALGHKIIMTETEIPLTVRRQVALSRAVYEQWAVVENMTGVLVHDYPEAIQEIENGNIAVIVDPQAEIRHEFSPDVIVDAIIAKRNLGTTMTDAPCVIALGPGFEAGKDCHAVIETMRGKTLGQPIYEGTALPNTGVPGMIGGYAIERLIQAAKEGKMHSTAQIGDHVKKGQILAYTGDEPVYAKIDGIVRGMLQNDVWVSPGLKIGDVDPRDDESLVYQISDKSRKIGRGVIRAMREHFYRDYGMVLLAAGLSWRFGSNKLLALIDGKPMFQHVAEIANEFSESCKVIVSRFPEIREYARETGICYTENEHPENGVSYSLNLGMKACLEQKPDLKGILFTVCDQPYLSEKTFDRVLEMAVRNPGKIICVGEKGEPRNPVIMDRKYFEDLRKLTGDEGGRQVIRQHPDQLLICETDEEELKDIDYKCAGWIEALGRLDAKKENLIFTELPEQGMGKKWVMSDGQLVWKENGSVSDGEELVLCSKTKETGLLEYKRKRIFAEKIGNENKLVICGAGHVSIPIIKTGKMTGFIVTVIDDRPFFADRARKAGASKVICEPFEQAMKQIEGDKDTFFVIVTRGHRYDQICLEAAAAKEHAYIGMMGSRKRVKIVKEQAIADGADPEVINHLCSPIGLDIGSETPEEIAVSVIAEVIQHKNTVKRSSGYTKEIISALREQDDERIRKTVATIIQRKGSAPRAVGTKMVIGNDGKCVGTIGGGCMEARVVRHAMDLMRESGRTQKLIWENLTESEAEDAGMVCGGMIEVLLETI